jgi:hypothetical protein
MKLSFLVAAPLLALVPLFTVGCGEGRESTENAAAAEEVDPDPEIDAGRDPDVRTPPAFEATVDAYGTGCPSGVWKTEIGDDGQTLTAKFEDSEFGIEPGQPLRFADCEIHIRLKSETERSFAVGELAFEGNASLQADGMWARSSAKYYFSGDPAPRTDHGVKIDAFDPEYTLDDTVAAPDLVWSACGATRDLRTDTHLVVWNNPQKTGRGSVNRDSASEGFQIHWTIFSHDCGAPPPPASDAASITSSR